MSIMSRSGLLACSVGAALALGTLCPAAAAPVAPLAGVSAGPGTAAIQVASRKKNRHKYRHTHRRSYGSDRAYAPQGYDNVGSVGQDGYGYGYNRFSGQRYQSCVFDEGYGRTRPCDAGGGGGGGRN
jgi:hypothetical protein